MNERYGITFGEFLYKDIDKNIYLNEIYDNILYNYAIGLFRIELPMKNVDIEAALRFSDLLSKSVDKLNSDRHKIWAQEIVALLYSLYPQNKTVLYYMGSVLVSTGNYRGMNMMTPEYQPSTLFERVYTSFDRDYLSIPSEPSEQFFRSQKSVYDHFKDSYFSYSGPTSMGKSFIMRMFIKQQIFEGNAVNFAILVPTKALINEVSSKIINDLKELLSKCNYRIVTSAGALVLKQQHNFIFVLTPERLLYLLIEKPSIQIDYLFVDEAHKISSKDSRSTFYYKVIDMLTQQKIKPHIFFASPNIPNPEVYLNLIPDVEESADNRITSTFAPVSQLKFFIDFVNRDVRLFNSYSGKLSNIAKIKKDVNFCSVLNYVGNKAQNIIYCSATSQAVDLALDLSKKIKEKSEEELMALSKDIKNEVHNDYYLAELVLKGVAYHIGYLPASIRLRIEELYRKGLITAVFCTSTLVEGVNLPADNLFVTSYKNGISQMDIVDFKNLVGRVGRIEYNLYGNVFLVRLDSKIKSEKFEELLISEVPEQSLSLVSGLENKYKEVIVQSLLEGKVDFPKQINQSEDAYSMMRKFALILLRDILSNRNSRVRMEFEPYLKNDDIYKIKEVFSNNKGRVDDDINVSLDQTTNLTYAIANGLCYPRLNDRGIIDYWELVDFLETLCKIFKWEQYEKKTLGFKSKNGNHSMLKWYAVILSQWMSGTGLSFIITKAIEFKRYNAKSKVKIAGKLVPYEDTLKHKNAVIAETLDAIEHVVQFSISNYFLRFSTEYKKFHKIDNMKNDWYEYVEYGTTNPLTITLQRSGFSRETSTYIKVNRQEYIKTMPDGEIKLKKSLIYCKNVSVSREASDIQYNIPELFVE